MEELKNLQTAKGTFMKVLAEMEVKNNLETSCGRAGQVIGPAGKGRPGCP